MDESGKIVLGTASELLLHERLPRAEDPVGSCSYPAVPEQDRRRYLPSTWRRICPVVIAAVVPENEMENYVEYISQYVGRENVYPMDIRAIGAVHIG